MTFLMMFVVKCSNELRFARMEFPIMDTRFSSFSLVTKLH